MVAETTRFSDMDAHTIATTIEMMQQQMSELRAALDSLRTDLIGRIREAGGRSLPDEDFVIELVGGSPTYDNEELRPLLEALPSDDLGKAYSPEHEEVRVVGERWNGTQLNRLERAYGGDIAARIQRARIPGADSLKVERKL